MEMVTAGWILVIVQRVVRFVLCWKLGILPWVGIGSSLRTCVPLASAMIYWQNCHLGLCSNRMKKGMPMTNKMPVSITVNAIIAFHVPICTVVRTK